MERLLKILKIDPQNAMACGDAVNDVEMLQLVGRGVCMGSLERHWAQRLYSHKRRVARPQKGSSEVKNP